MSCVVCLVWCVVLCLVSCIPSRVSCVLHLVGSIPAILPTRAWVIDVWGTAWNGVTSCAICGRPHSLVLEMSRGVNSTPQFFTSQIRQRTSRTPSCTCIHSLQVPLVSLKTELGGAGWSVCACGVAQRPRPRSLIRGLPRSARSQSRSPSEVSWRLPLWACPGIDVGCR